MKRNDKISLRVLSETKKDIKEISEALGFKQADMTRYLLRHGIKEMKKAAQQAGGYDNLEITLRPSKA